MELTVIKKFRSKVVVSSSASSNSLCDSKEQIAIGHMIFTGYMYQVWCDVQCLLENKRKGLKLTTKSYTW